MAPHTHTLAVASTKGNLFLWPTWAILKHKHSTVVVVVVVVISLHIYVHYIVHVCASVAVFI